MFDPDAHLVIRGWRLTVDGVLRNADATRRRYSRAGRPFVAVSAEVTVAGWAVEAFLDDAAEPDRVRPGALIVAGDPVEPFLARVVHIIEDPGGSIVHLDVVGVPEGAIDELRHAQLLPW